MEINTINLVGRAGREPDVRYFESGSIVANFTIAVNRRSRDEEVSRGLGDVYKRQLNGLTALMLPGVLPSINFASLPTANGIPSSKSIATTEGSCKTTPFPDTCIRVLAVPKSMPISRENLNLLKITIRISFFK